MLQPTPICRSWLGRLHADERGNLGVLLLLTIWALVALIAMVWNTGEFATRRRHVQSAADAAAHASSLWVARTTNLTASSNLVICQNGSAEVLLRSITPTATDLQTRFNREGERARQLQRGSYASIPEQGVPDCEYFEELLGFGAWAGKGRGDQRQAEFTALVPAVQQAMAQVLPLLPPPQQQQISRAVADGIAENGIVLRWVLDSYIGPVGGGGGGLATAPAPAAFTPVGVPVRNWITNDVRPRLSDILSTLDVEQSWLDRWIAQTAPALGMTPEQLRQARAEIFEYQQQIRQLTPEVVAEQRAAIADFYEVDASASVPGRPYDEPEPTPVTAPVMPSAWVASQPHLDSIRQRYPSATAIRWGSSSPMLWVDPVNVNVGFSAIWHPGQSYPVTGVTLDGQTYQGNLSVGGGEWGRVPCAPLNRYLNDRVYRDREGLRAEPRAIDDERTALRGRIFPPPGPPAIAELPQQLETLDSAGNPIRLPPRQIPTIPLPAELTEAHRQAIEAVNDRIRTYNRELRDFLNDLRGLENAADRMHQYLGDLADRSSQRFADATWLRHVIRNRDLVLRLMGDDRAFMVLSTYKLHEIPDWATAGMRDDVRRHVYNQVYNRHINGARQRLIRQLEQWAMNVLGVNAPGAVNRSALRNRARQFAQQNGPPAAEDAVRRAAEIVSREVAEEWVRRPWPFEVAPPEEPVPPTRGLSDEERQRYFTAQTAALTTEETARRPVLDKYFGHDTGPLVSFAQSEIFNWMEWHEAYGAGDRFDQITFYGHGDMGGFPRPWRLSSPGGWSWEPRLAFSDAIAPAVADGEHFRAMLEKGGVDAGSENNRAAMDLLTQH